MLTYDITAELPDLAITWKANDGSLLDLATGYTFALEIRGGGASPLLTKSTGITGAATDPNVTISWVPGEFDDLAKGSYSAKLTAHHAASNKDRVMHFLIGFTS